MVDKVQEGGSPGAAEDGFVVPVDTGNEDSLGGGGCWRYGWGMRMIEGCEDGEEVDQEGQNEDEGEGTLEGAGSCGAAVGGPQHAVWVVRSSLVIEENDGDVWGPWRPSGRHESDSLVNHRKERRKN